jgi:DNA invertase Pin-like site-specific DNA recombinase
LCGVKALGLIIKKFYREATFDDLRNNGYGAISIVREESLSERVKRGMNKRKAEGLPVGRPRAFDYKDMISLYREGLPTSVIASRLGIAVKTVQNNLAKFKRSDINLEGK